MAAQNQDNNITQSQLDIFDVPLTVPANKLDADQYSADDLDGVTESIFGSGNMAYASLQASQTDALLHTNEPFELDSGILPGEENVAATNTDRPVGDVDTSGAEMVGNEGSFANTTVGSLGASTLSSDIGSFTPDSNLSIGADSFFGKQAEGALRNSGGGNTGSEAINNETNNDGNTVTNTTNVNNGDDTTIIEDVTNIIEDITNLGDELIENILEGDISETINVLTTEIDEITEMLNTTVNEITDIVNTFLEDINITDITNNVTDITNEITDTVTNILNEVLGGEIGLDLDLGMLDTLGAGLGLDLDDSLAGQLSLESVAGGLTNVTNSLTGLNVPFVADTGLVIGFDLLNGSNGPDGNDITVNGLDIPNLDLDLVESVVGDINIELTLPTELLDAETLVEGAQDVVGGLSDLDLASVDEALDILGDEGIEGSIEAVLGTTGLGEEFDIDLDDVLGGYGLGDTVDGVVETAGDVADALTGGATGDLTEGVEEAVDQVTDVVDDLAGDLLGGNLPGGDNDSGTDSDVTADLGIDALNTEIIDEPLDVGLDVVEDLVGDVDLDLGLGTDLLGDSETDNDAGDTDITVDTDIDIVDNVIGEVSEEIPLDAVEEIIGDVDVDVATDLLGNIADPLVNDGEGGTGEDTILADVGDTLGDAAESLLDGSEGDEAGVGDLVEDIDVGDALGLLDGGDAEGGEEAASEDGETSWTESTIDDVGGLFDDVVDGIGGESDDLPDPSGTIGEGLGVLDVDPDAGLDGGLGGLFG